VAGGVSPLVLLGFVAASLPDNLLVGIDVGTSSVKAILIDGAGSLLADFAWPVAMSRPAAGYAEQNPTDWTDGIYAALTAFAARHNLSGLVGIGITSQVNTHVFVESGGAALIPAITWQDTRCAADAATLAEQASSAQRTSWFGRPALIDASHTLARMAYVARVHRDVYAKTRHVLLPKDYCVMRLTGAVLSDAISAVRLAGPSGYVDELLDLVPRSRELLPELARFHYVAGRVREGMPCAGTPVVVGAMDAWAGMFGSGVLNDGDAMYQSGTSEILGIISSTVNSTPGVIVFPPYQGTVLHAAPTQSGGAALQWLSGVLGKTAAQLSVLAAETEPSEAIPLFLPHLQGERAPIWDATSRGAFARIDSRTGAAEMARSVMQGVAFSARWAFQALQESSGCALSLANISGGGARSDTWCQIRADALGFALQRTAVLDAAVLGAAILAGLGAETVSSIGDAVRQLVKFGRTFEPRAAYHAYYDEKFGQFQALYTALRSIDARCRG
jgi:xylulokinase